MPLKRPSLDRGERSRLVEPFLRSTLFLSGKGAFRTPSTVSRTTHAFCTAGKYKPDVDLKSLVTSIFACSTNSNMFTFSERILQIDGQAIIVGTKPRGKSSNHEAAFTLEFLYLLGRVSMSRICEGRALIVKDSNSIRR
jgi:hypothetical protein